MAVAQLNVLTGLYDHLKADSDFNTAMGGSASSAGRIWFDIAERDGSFPFCIVTPVSSIDADVMDKDGYEYTVQFSIFDLVENGAGAVVGHMDKLRARLHRVRVTVSGHVGYRANEEILRGPFREDGVWRQDADYVLSGFVT